MLKVPAMILGVKGPSNQHCNGGGGGMREFAVFWGKCPKTFGQDCSFVDVTVLFSFTFLCLLGRSLHLACVNCTVATHAQSSLVTKPSG